MRTTFDNSMVAHVWAQQKQDNGRGSNFFFEKETIYSFGRHFPIARFIDKKTVLFTNADYSNSTTRHKNYVWRALSDDVRVFKVARPDSDHYHAENLDDYKKRINQLVELCKKARSNLSWRLRELKKLIHEHDDYLNKLRKLIKEHRPNYICRKYKLPKDFDLAAYELKAIEYDAAEKKRDDERAKRAEARRLVEQEKRREDLVKWQAGEHVSFFNWYTEESGYLLRIKPNNPEIIETSGGAEVPVKHCQRLLPLIRSGKGYKRNGHTEHVGHFSLDEITVDGDIKVGCHRIKRAEIERIASLLGV